MRRMIVAVGGGGDAITAVALRRLLHLAEAPAVLTYSWDRLMVDPLPGPRTAEDFEGLVLLAPGLHQVTSATRPIPPAGSSLPRLAAELACQVILLDPLQGAVDMARQIVAASELFGASSLVAVDVGGDALTDGTEPGLRSPLADQLALASCMRTGLPTTLLIAAAGIDGELTDETLRNRFERFGAERIGSLTGGDIASQLHVFRWHPSEASGLLAAAATGLRGVVEVRDAGDHVVLTNDTPVVYAIELTSAIDDIPARHILDSSSLAQAEKIIRATTGISELDYESRKASRHLAHDGPACQYDINRVDALAAEASHRGADMISVRRLAELLGIFTMRDFQELTELLILHRANRLVGSAYRTRA